MSMITWVMLGIPAGWAESALGRRYKMSAVNVLGKLAGLSTTLSIMEIPVTCIMGGLGWSRKKSIFTVTAIALIGAIPCVWSDAFFTFFDNLIGNVFYSVTAAVIAVFLAWFIGARKIREEWYNPTSVIKYGSWVDFLYKFVSVPAFIYFAVTAVLTLV